MKYIFETDFAIAFLQNLIDDTKISITEDMKFSESKGYGSIVRIYLKGYKTKNPVTFQRPGEFFQS